jgi:hypothetical protein
VARIRNEPERKKEKKKMPSAKGSAHILLGPKEHFCHKKFIPCRYFSKIEKNSDQEEISCVKTFILMNH